MYPHGALSASTAPSLCRSCLTSCSASLLSDRDLSVLHTVLGRSFLCPRSAMCHMTPLKALAPAIRFSRSNNPCECVEESSLSYSAFEDEARRVSRLRQPLEETFEGVELLELVCRPVSAAGEVLQVEVTAACGVARLGLALTAGFPRRGAKNFGRLGNGGPWPGAWRGWILGGGAIDVALRWRCLRLGVSAAARCR